MGFEWPWQQAGDSGQSHFRRGLGKGGKVIGEGVLASTGALGAGVNLGRVVVNTSAPGKSAASTFGSRFDLVGKTQNQFAEIGRGIEDSGAKFSRGLQDFQRDQSAAFAEGLSNLGAGLGAGAGNVAAGTFGGLGAGIGGAASGAASGIGEGIKSLAIPALIVVGLLFLKKKAT